MCNVLDDNQVMPVRDLHEAIHARRQSPRVGYDDRLRSLGYRGLQLLRIQVVRVRFDVNELRYRIVV